MIGFRDVTKVYSSEGAEVHALRGVSFTIDDGEFMAIMGPSGSGKSTLLHILGCLDVPTSGQYLLDGVDVGELDDDELASIRGAKVGFVFQSYNLLPRMRAVDQVELPMTYARVRDRRDRAQAALAEVGLEERERHLPQQLSGGEQQRVAIARCIAMNPSIILADEPTGALDTATGEQVMRLFGELSVQRGITVIVVTHEPSIAAHARRTIMMRDGLVISDNPSAGIGA